MSNIKGVIVLTRNGDRAECYQDPATYKYATTESTALGEAQAHQLGSVLRSAYLEPSSSTYIKGVSTELADLKQVHVRVKIGSEGNAVFDSTTALLQGLYPPTPKNKITLANDTTITAPLGGYQYIPVETVEPFNDLSLESWTGCPAFEKHIKEVHDSDEFKKMEKAAQPFFEGARDFIFGRPATLANIWNIHDYMSSQLTHNKTYAFRLPPFLVHQARALVDWHQDKIFSDKSINGVGNIAGRTTLHSILTALERISYDHDPLKLLVIGTTYQPMISFFHMTDAIAKHPELKALPEYASALVLELVGGAPPDSRDFVRVKFRNGTHGSFETIELFGHNGDIPLTEFIYRLEGSVIDSPAKWASACGGHYRVYDDAVSGISNAFGIEQATVDSYVPNATNFFFGAILALFVIFGGLFFRRQRINRRKGSIQLPITQEVSPNMISQNSQRANYLSTAGH